MNYLILLKSPGLGEYIHGIIEAQDKIEAQNLVADMLVSADTPRDKIGKQVTDYSTLTVGQHTVTIAPISVFDEKKAKILVAHTKG